MNNIHKLIKMVKFQYQGYILIKGSTSLPIKKILFKEL